MPNFLTYKYFIMPIYTKNLLILGDSFCSDRARNTDWPIIVQNSLLTSLHGQGFPGASWWSTRNSFIKQIAVASNIAIFCHTEPNRIPHNDNWGLNIGSTELGLIYEHGRSTPMTNEFKLACELYYKHLWCPEYHEWALTRWLCELDELTKGIEIVLHFFGFDHHASRYHKFQHGVSFSDALVNYATMTHAPDITNHFDIATNQRFADFVLEHIHNYPGAGVRIDRKLDLR